MTKEQLLEALKACSKMMTEEGHLEADRLLLKYINDDDITKRFESLHRWYA